MAFSSLRRSLTLTPSLARFHRSLSSLPNSSIARPQSPPSLPSSTILPRNPSRNTQISWFRSSLPCSSSRSSYNDDEKISPDTILFEGCDYEHWLITMDFPKDPKPSPEEMVETYVQTLAKVVGSVEEAKKRMYACSTTTYNGFQAVMSEEMSEKFRGLPGVVFILPDSYIDPVNKEYGGDKYINGTIIPRPPPVQYSRRGRYDDRNRNRQGPPQGDGRNYEGPRQNYSPPQNFNPSSSAPGDGRNYGGPQQNYGGPQQNYGPPQNFGPSPPVPGGNGGPQQNYGPPQNFGPSSPAPGDGRNYGVAPQNYPPQNFAPAVPGDGRNYGPPQNYPPQRNLGSYPTGQGDGRSVGAQQNYGPNPVGQSPLGNRDYVPERRDNYQNERSGTLPSYQRDFPQAGAGGHSFPENRDFRGNSRSTYPPAGDFSQGPGSSYGQSYPVHGEGQRFPQGDGRQ